MPFPRQVHVAALTAAIAVAAPEPIVTGQSQRFAAGTTAVVVDVIVRDEDGRPVLDLRRDEFELFEDEVAQEILEFSAPASPQQDAAAAASEGALAPALERIGSSHIAFVIGRLSPEERALVHDALRGYLARRRPAELAAVFVLDRSLVAI